MLQAKISLANLWTICGILFFQKCFIGQDCIFVMQCSLCKSLQNLHSCYRNCVHCYQEYIRGMFTIRNAPVSTIWIRAVCFVITNISGETRTEITHHFRLESTKAPQIQPLIAFFNLLSHSSTKYSDVFTRLILTLTVSYSSIWNQNVPQEIPFFIRNQYSAIARKRSNTTAIIVRVKI